MFRRRLFHIASFLVLASGAALPWTLNPKQNNDIWTAGITLGIGF